MTDEKTIAVKVKISLWQALKLAAAEFGTTVPDYLRRLAVNDREVVSSAHKLRIKLPNMERLKNKRLLRQIKQRSLMVEGSSGSRIVDLLEKRGPQGSNDIIDKLEPLPVRGSDEESRETSRLARIKRDNLRNAILRMLKNGMLSRNDRGIIRLS